MEDSTNFVEMMKKILGEEEYQELLLDISKEANKKKINLEDFFEDILNKYCFIIFMIGMSKKIEVERYKFKTKNQSFEIEGCVFAEKYEKYIKEVENKKFEMAKTMI